MVNTIFIMNEHLKVIKVLTVNGQNTFFDDLYTLDLSTGSESYEFSTNVDVEESDYVMFYYHNQYKLFQITEIEQEHSKGEIITNVYGESICLELLNNVVRPFEGEYNCISFFRYILEGTDWSIGEYSTSLAEKVLSVKVDKTTQIWAIIQDYMAEFGYELNPRVIYENGYVKYKVIDIFAEGGLGEKTYKRFEYGRNVTGITKKKDLYDFCTALIIDTDQDIVDIVYDKDGYYKAQGSDVILAKKENKLYNLGRDYIYGSFEDKDSQSGIEAVEKAVEDLKKRAVPRFDYECDTALTWDEFNEINIGDTVYCIDSTFDPVITLEARVGKLELSFTDRDNCKCNLTNYKEIKSKISAELTGTIQGIINSYFPITTDKLANGCVDKDKINVETYDIIIADSVGASKVVTEELVAKEIIAINGQFQNLDTKYATIENLNVTNGNISTLTSDLAEITTLVNGNLTSDNIQSIVITGDKFTVVDGFIKNAMIDTVSADKINTGTLNTNNVSIQSEDGSMLINGTTQQFKDKNGKVRIQIGKDATGDFTFALFSQDGQGILIDETGIKAGAVPDGLIVNDMVADNANISGNKLDISSVITSINNNTTSIKSSAIKFDDTGQTLQVAFNELKTKVDTIENVTVDGNLSSVIEQVTTNTTNIGVMQGQISSLISNTTITKEDGTVVQLKDEYNSTKDTVNSHTTKIGSLETNYNKVSGDIASVTSKQSTLEQNLDEVSSTLTQTTTTANEAKTQASTNKQTIDSMSTTLTNTTKTANEAKAQSSTNKQTIDSMSTELTSATTTANSALNKATTAQQNLDGFKTTVSRTYTTKTDADNTYATKSALSEVKQTADSLTTEVSKKLNSEDLSSRIQQSPNDIKIGFNKITDFITIDPNNGLQVNHEDGSYTRISPGGFSLYNASKNYRYKALIATGYFSIKGKGTSVITLPAQFDDVSEWDVDFFFTIETNWGAASSAVDKTCIYEMYANDIFQIGMTKDSDGHWTKKVDYSLIDVCVKAGGSMQVGDRGDMFGFVHWIAFA